MSHWRRVTAAAAAIPLLFINLAACTPSDQTQQSKASPPPQQGSPSDPVHRVNGRAITRAELDRAVRSLVETRRLHHPPSAEELGALKKEALEGLISKELLYQAAQKSEVKNLEQQVAQAIALDRARYRGGEAYASEMRKAGLTLPQMEQLVRKELVIDRFLESKFGARITIGADEAKSFYETNRERFRTGSSVRASHILVTVAERAQEQEKERARERAEILLHRVREGENFGILAESHSDCPSKARGGDLGFCKKGELDPPLEQAVSALNPGEISDLVQTRFGFHILKVTERRAPRPESYQEAEAEIYACLRREKMRRLVAEYVAELRARAKVEPVGAGS
ncbi:peptidylprolyl isomerase [Geomonas sp. Red69]|uniref:Peptidylprolyl isomerase n=1 Tax=Geomonas diazotrophica TaxID=2843197 RepID=A0ABX8JIA5_9BACT|nr:MULTISPECIES: peptidylprolyl isomerase [Geomonas]MBU5635736.1 peptidylprolyl isomerase [Geomonas diazotrophica]QWV98028.1 peptidylprolyl isomerase [Geomonas nitrogeniifigens]QXE87159.1 peptidylprolyl isomerase [Geomonas nitrogeniifigens]